MTDDPVLFPVDERPRRRRFALSWLTLLALGWLVYEMTAQPVLGILSVCVKFGWERFRTAWWLLGVDPARRRAWTCFTLYVASALCRVAGAAAMLSAAFILEMIILLDLGVVRQPDLRAAVLATLGTLGVNILCAAVAGCAAVVLAHKYRIKVWLHPSVDSARRHDLWPPPDRSPDDRNQAEAIMAFGAGLTFLAIYIVALYCLDNIVIFVAPGLLPLFFACAGRNGQSGRQALAPLLASRPSECWAEADRVEEAVPHESGRSNESTREPHRIELDARSNP
jgi:hypothetical protein